MLPGEGTPNMKGVGMLVRSFFLTPKRDHVKTQTIYIFSHATLIKTFTAKYDGVLPRTP